MLVLGKSGLPLHFLALLFKLDTQLGILEVFADALSRLYKDETSRRTALDLDSRAKDNLQNVGVELSLDNVDFDW